MSKALPASDQKQCHFCLDNGLLEGDIVASSANAHLIEANTSAGNFLIVPKVHAESLLSLPDSWWQEVKSLLPQIPGLVDSYNVSVNIGLSAGQSMKHIHFWVVPRAAGLPASGKGLARLIDEVNARCR